VSELHALSKENLISSNGILKVETTLISQYFANF